MLSISLCLDRDLVSPYCKKIKTPYSPAFYLYLAENRGQVLSSALFEVCEDKVRVLLYESTERDDAALFDGVIRAGLNYAADQGIATGQLPEGLRAVHSHLFDKLNYPIHTEFNITNFFQKYKSCLS